MEDLLHYGDQGSDIFEGNADYLWKMLICDREINLKFQRECKFFKGNVCDLWFNSVSFEAFRSVSMFPFFFQFVSFGWESAHRHGFLL